MNKVRYLITLFFFLIIIPFYSSESQEHNNSSAIVDSQDFNDYWYDGKAEITSYKLEQARYGELHEGYVVLVFVTED